MSETELESASKAETRQRLLEAAGEIFAEVGYAKATIRDICQRADANIAAVNYHFRDKEGLYLEVVRYVQSLSHSFQEAGPATAGLPADQRLGMFIRGFLVRAIGKDRMAWHGKMIAREMSEPTGLLDRIVEEEIRPRANVLEGIVREMLGAAASQWRVEACMRSVVSQCIYYHLCRPVIERLHPSQGFEPADLEKLARHIAQFSIAAIHGIATQKEPS